MVDAFLLSFSRLRYFVFGVAMLRKKKLIAIGVRSAAGGPAGDSETVDTSELHTAHTTDVDSIDSKNVPEGSVAPEIVHTEPCGATGYVQDEVNEVNDSTKLRSEVVSRDCSPSSATHLDEGVESFDMKLTQAANSFQQYQALIKQLARSLRSLCANRTSLVDLQAQQDRLCEAEDFEAAERLDGEVAKTSSAIWASLAETRDDLAGLLAFILSIGTFNASWGTDLLHTAHSCAARVDVRRAALLDSQSVAVKRLASMEAMIQNDASRLGDVSLLLDEAQHAYNDARESVELQTAEAQNRGQLVADELSRTDAEISQLEAQLDALRQRRADLVGQLADNSTEIAATRSRCLERVREAKTELDRLAQTVAEYGVTQARLDALKSEKAQLEESCERIVSELSTLEDDAQNSVAFATHLGSTLSGFEQYVAEVIPALRTMTESVSAMSSSVTENQSEIAFLQESIADEISALDTHLSFVASLDSSLAALQESKKVATTNRDFTAARDASARIKELTDRRESAGQVEQKHRAEISRLRERLAELQSVSRSAYMEGLGQVFTQLRYAALRLPVLDSCKSDSMELVSKQGIVSEFTRTVDGLLAARDELAHELAELSELNFNAKERVDS